MTYILFVIFLATVGVVGDFFIKLSGNGAKFMDVKLFVIGMLVYSSTAIGWFYAMKHVKLSYIGVLYSLTTVLLLVGIGVFYFHERMTAYEILGTVLAVFSIILLSRFA